MRHRLWVLALLLCAAAPADEFQRRIGAANLIYATPGGTRYQLAISPYIDKVIQACIPPGKQPPGALGKFIFVADVTKAGQVSAPEVQPATGVSQCFLAQFSRIPLPPPPLPTDARINYPIVIEMNVTP